MNLIIIQGESCTGKTALAKRLANDFKMPVFLRDGYKETIYNTMEGTPSLGRWWQIEKASWRELYRVVQAAVLTDQPLIIESTFTGRQKRWLQRSFANNTLVTEIYCYANGKVIRERFKKRYSTGERHRGHRDNLWVPVLWLEVNAAKIGWHWIKPLGLSNKPLYIDTSNYLAVDYVAIKQFIKEKTLTN